MLVAKTPLRISFFGGGSDLPAFMNKEVGASLSATINLYNYVTINETQRPIRFIHEDIQYGLANMRNHIVKETLQQFHLKSGLDIVSMSDVHATGAGLGGSSAFTVGLLNALYAINDDMFFCINPETLAKKACEIEIDFCNYPIGIQDQYAVAYGGMNLFKFYGNPRYAHKVETKIKPEIIKALESRLVLIYSGVSRNGNSGTILQRQQSSMKDDKTKFDTMRLIRDRAYQGVELLEAGDLIKFGQLLHANWMDKKSLTGDLSNPEFDAMYDFAMKEGAVGGKLLGAGGGGFFLFYVPRMSSSFIPQMTKQFPNSRYYPFQFTEHGSTITKV